MLLALLREQSFERSLPTRAERRNAQGALQLIPRVARQIEQAIDFRNGDPLRPVSDFCNFVSGADLPFFNHAEVKARPFMGNKECRYLRVIHSDADAIAGDPRLRHLEECAPDSVAISNADLIIGKTIDGEILTELAILKVLPLQLLLPVTVGVELIHHQGAMLSAVPCKVALAIAIQVETARHHPSGDGSLKDSSADYLALPLDIARQPDIHRDERIHLAFSSG